MSKKRGGNNNQNLIPLNKRTKGKQREIASKGGKASVEARRKKKAAKEYLQMIDELPASPADQTKLADFGIPADDRTQEAAAYVGLNNRRRQGCPVAHRLWLEIKGEAPAQKVDVTMSNQEARQEVKEMLDALKDGG